MSLKPALIDLHTHSTASDGTVPPQELVRLAACQGITTLALTDHDTLSGLDEAEAEATALGLEFIRGCELSSTADCGSVDILGLWVPKGDKNLEEKLARLEYLRQNRCFEMLEKLRKLGFDLELEELRQLVGEQGKAPGRPHLARLLLKKKYVTSIREAFDRYLGEGSPAYVPKAMLTPAQAVEMLAQAGATPAIAHPMLIRASNERLEQLVRELKPHGLAALEAYHSEHRESGVRTVVQLAAMFQLEMCGGSDFHGEVKPSISLGVGHGKLRVPPHLLHGLKLQRQKLGLPV